MTDSEQLIGVCQSMLQHENFMIQAFFIFVALLLGATWLWNVHFASREIKKEIDLKVSEHKKSIDDSLVAKHAELTSQIKSELKTDLLRHEAEIARVFAFSNANAGVHKNAASWWALAIGHYAKLDDQKFIRIATDGLSFCLTKMKTANKKIDKDDLDEIEASAKTNIPSILDKERQDILNLIDDIRKCPAPTAPAAASGS